MTLSVTNFFCRNELYKNVAPKNLDKNAKFDSIYEKYWDFNKKLEKKTIRFHSFVIKIKCKSHAFTKENTFRNVSKRRKCRFKHTLKDKYILTLEPIVDPYDASLKAFPITQCFWHPICHFGRPDNVYQQ